MMSQMAHCYEVTDGTLLYVSRMTHCYDVTDGTLLYMSQMAHCCDATDGTLLYVSRMAHCYMCHGWHTAMMSQMTHCYIKITNLNSRKSGFIINNCAGTDLVAVTITNQSDDSADANFLVILWPRCQQNVTNMCMNKTNSRMILTISEKCG